MGFIYYLINPFTLFYMILCGILGIYYTSFRLYNSNFVTQRFNLQYKSFSQLELLEQSWK